MRQVVVGGAGFILAPFIAKTSAPTDEGWVYIGNFPKGVQNHSHDGFGIDGTIRPGDHRHIGINSLIETENKV